MKRSGEEEAVTPGVAELHGEGEGGVGDPQGPVRGPATRHVQDARDAANLIITFDHLFV